MTDLANEIDGALLDEKTIQRDRVVVWIRTAGDDLHLLAKLYQLTGAGYDRIQPELGADDTCTLIQHYLLECVRQDIPDDEAIESRWDAARTLHAWLCHLGEMSGQSAIIERAAKAITELFLNSDGEIRDAIECGFLEHVLEMQSLRPFFEHWSADSRLQPAWNRAMEWAKDHPEHTWSLMRSLSMRDDC